MLKAQQPCVTSGCYTDTRLQTSEQQNEQYFCIQGILFQDPMDNKIDGYASPLHKMA
jgi:hypothetical protein